MDQAPRIETHSRRKSNASIVWLYNDSNWREAIGHWSALKAKEEAVPDEKKEKNQADTAKDLAASLPEEIDIEVWSTIRECLARLDNPETGYFTWTEDEQARFNVCCHHANAAVMKSARVVISTSNNLACEVIAKNFGEAGDFVVKMADEAGMTPEPDEWVGIIKLRQYKKVTGMWLFGDHSQLSPLIFSLFVGVSPFAAQLEWSLFSRLYLSGYVHKELRLSGRMHYDLLRFSDWRTYNGTLRSTHVANHRPLPAKYSAWYKKYFDQEKDEVCRLFAVIFDSECKTDPRKFVDDPSSLLD